MYERSYVSVKGISLFGEEFKGGAGLCKNGHYNFIPARTKMVAGKNLCCPNCGAVYWKCIAIKVTETEITEESLYNEKIYELYSKVVALRLKILSDCTKTGSTHVPFKIEIDLMEDQLVKMGNLF